MTKRERVRLNFLSCFSIMVSLAVFGLSGCGSGGGEESGVNTTQDPATAAASSSDNTVVASEPVELSANAVSSAEIDLAWSPATDDGGLTSYRIWRNGSQIATLENVTAYEDTGLSASTAYAYTVEVIDEAGNISGRSREAVATTQAPDPTPPLVTSVSTEDAMPVAVNSAITVDFSVPMSKPTLNPSTFKVATRGGIPIQGAVSVSGNTATFTPAAELPADTEHSATITTGATDSAGNALAADFATTFATAAVADTTPPRVSSVFPANAATGVALNSTVSVVFSEAMTNATLTTASFTLKRTSGGTAVGGTVKVSGRTATFSPLAVLAKNTQYTATVTTAAKDAAGNALGANFTWTFSTGASSDTTAPQIISRDPGSSATEVTLNAIVKVTFSEQMSASTLTTASFRLSSGAPLSGIVLYDAGSKTVSFIPSPGSLVAGTKYTAVISNAVKDAAGNPLAASFGWNFTTAGTLDTTRPTVTTTSPMNLATGVAANSLVSATFSESMRNSTLTTASVTVAKTIGGAAVAGTVSVTGNTVTFTPSTALAGSTQYTATVTTVAKDAAGNPLAANFIWIFTTAAATTTAALAWDAITATNLGGYRVYYGTAPGAYIQAAGQGLNVGKVSTYTVTGLSRGKRYYFAVTAFDTSNNESAFSNEVYKDIP